MKVLWDWCTAWTWPRLLSCLTHISWCSNNKRLILTALPFPPSFSVHYHCSNTGVFSSSVKKIAIFHRQMILKAEPSKCSCIPKSLRPEADRDRTKLRPARSDKVSSVMPPRGRNNWILETLRICSSSQVHSGNRCQQRFSFTAHKIRILALLKAWPWWRRRKAGKPTNALILSSGWKVKWHIKRHVAQLLACLEPTRLLLFARKMLVARSTTFSRRVTAKQCCR